MAYLGSRRLSRSLVHLLRKPVEIRRFASDEKGERGIVVGIYEKETEGDEPRLTSSGMKFDDRVGGKLLNLCREYGINGKLGKGKIFNNLDPEFKAVAIVGLGKDGVGYNELESIDEGMENARFAAAVGAKFLQKQGCSHLQIDSMEYPEQAAEGATLSTWLYQDNRREKDRKPRPAVDLYDSEAGDLDSWTRGVYKARAQNLARYLSDSPANQMTPSLFAQKAVDILCKCGVNVEVRNMDWIEQQGLNSFLTVARSSCEPPVFLEMSYCGQSAEEKPILLVGKGLTFNSGGLCLRTPQEMSDCRGCMAGAAVVVATMQAAASLSLPINITAVIPLCENMPSGLAFRVGDVVNCLNGRTLAIHDCSKVGVVVMADTLTYAQNTYKPKLIVDVATISTGIRKALGGGGAGIFCNTNYLWKEFHRAGALSGDRLWRMPLWQFYTNNVKDHRSVDVSNKGFGEGSACLAAAVLREFVPSTDWAHIDIRGVGMLSDSNAIPYLVKGRMTGRPTRTLIQFLYQMACPEN